MIKEIVPGLYQGSHLYELPENIEAVLNVDATSARYTTELLTQYIHLPIFDGPSPGQEWLVHAVALLELCRAKKWVTYVHCQAGISRSVFVTAGLLIKELGITPESAIDLINKQTQIADPAPAFILELRKFHASLV